MKVKTTMIITYVRQGQGNTCTIINVDGDTHSHTSCNYNRIKIK